MSKKNRYSQIIELIFFKYYKAGSTTIRFTRDDIIKCAQELEIFIPKNIGDLVYSYRYRTSLPGAKSEALHQRIHKKAFEGRLPSAQRLEEARRSTIENQRSFWRVSGRNMQTKEK